MTAGRRLIEGAEEALAIAKGEQPAAAIWHNGHKYVPAEQTEQLRSALKEFLWGDPALAEILWGDLPDDRTMTFQISLGAYRRARAALDGARP
jgi:hypothetical protein